MIKLYLISIINLFINFIIYSSSFKYETESDKLLKLEYSKKYQLKHTLHVILLVVVYLCALYNFHYIISIIFSSISTIIVLFIMRSKVVNYGFSKKYLMYDLLMKISMIVHVILANIVITIRVKM